VTECCCDELVGGGLRRLDFAISTGRRPLDYCQRVVPACSRNVLAGPGACVHSSLGFVEDEVLTKQPCRYTRTRPVAWLLAADC